MINHELYVNNFKGEDIGLPAYHKLNKRKLEHVPEKGYKDSIYYEAYCQFLIDNQIMTFEECTHISSYFPKSYYDYIINFPALYFAVLHSIDSTFKAKIIKKNTLLLTNPSKKLVFLAIVHSIFSTTEIDKNFRNNITKTKILNKLEPILVVMLQSLTIEFRNHIDEEYEEQELEESFLKKINKTLALMENILISLQVCLPIKDFSKLSSKRETNSFELSGVTDTELLENLKLDLDQSDESDNSQTSNLLSMTVSVTNHKKRYLSLGKSYLLFSQQVQFLANLTMDLNRSKGSLVKDKYIKFENEFNTQAVFVYNRANPKTYSKFKYDISLVSYLITENLILSKVLFETIKPYLKLKYKKDSQGFDRMRMLCIYEQLGHEFKFNKVLNLYFPYIVDFRGRIYMQSLLSITSVKLLRYIINPNTTNNNIKKNKYYYLIKGYLFLLKDKLNTELYTEEELIIIILGFLNIGKIVKSSLLKTNNSIKISEFIITGIDIFNSNIQDIVTRYVIKNVDDLGFIVSSKIKLMEYLNKKSTNFTLVVDSTASGIFHLSIWLKLKEKYHKYINISDDHEWWDTYQCLFNLVMEKFDQDEYLPQRDRQQFNDNLRPLFTRKRIKMIFMTLPYNAQNNTLYDYFCEGDPKVQNKKEFKNLFILFLNYVELVFSEIFYHKMVSLHELPFFNKGYVFSFMNNTYDFNYYKTEYKDVKHTVNYEKMYSSLVSVILEKDMWGNLTDKPKLNKRKTLTAFIANVIHATDANFMATIYKRCHLRGIKINTIHDEFIVPVNNYFEFIEISNEVYNEMYEEINLIPLNSNNYFIFI